eukprot:gb/GECG01001405.1/.p1 GENE.gb/GECG01001405.1/~~gb/GECG01001405.1/.p1  ORF type:complete len:604 (+),score=63.72 gb/GECG01001405.1/:1-1812(+)
MSGAITCGAIALLDGPQGDYHVLNATCGEAPASWLHGALQSTRRYFTLLRLNRGSRLRQFTGHAHLGEDIYIAYLQLRQICIVVLYQASMPTVKSTDLMSPVMDAAHMFVVRLLRFLMTLGKASTLEAAQSKVSAQVVYKNYTVVSVAMRRIVNGGFAPPQDFKEISRIGKWQTAALTDKEQWAVMAKPSTSYFWDPMAAPSKEGSEESDTGVKSYKFNNSSEHVWKNFVKGLPLTGKHGTLHSGHHHHHHHHHSSQPQAQPHREEDSFYRTGEFFPSRRNRTLQNFRKGIFEVARAPPPASSPSSRAQETVSLSATTSSIATTQDAAPQESLKRQEAPLTASLNETINIKLEQRGKKFVGEESTMALQFENAKIENQLSLGIKVTASEHFATLKAGEDNAGLSERQSNEAVVPIGSLDEIQKSFRVCAIRTPQQHSKVLGRVAAAADVTHEYTTVKLLISVHPDVLDYATKVLIRVKIPIMERRTLSTPQCSFPVTLGSSNNAIQLSIEGDNLESFKKQIKESAKGRINIQCVLKASDTSQRTSERHFLDSLMHIYLNHNSEASTASRLNWSVTGADGTPAEPHISSHTSVVKVKCTESSTT